MGILIFDRTNKGISVSKEGEIFLGYARQVLDQTSLIEENFFAVNAFIDLIKEYGKDNYDFSIHETQTYEIMEDVTCMKSEIGILYYNNFNKAVLQKMIKANDVKFTELFIAKPHIFVNRGNPLSKRKSVTMEELAPFQYLSFEQGEHNSFYYSEEIFSTVIRSKNIRVCDRATLFNLLIGLIGYTVCSGVIDEKLNGENIVAIPLEAEGDMQIGYVTRWQIHISRLGAFYIKALKKYIKHIDEKNRKAVLCYS